MTVRDWAIILAVLFWGALVVMLCYVLAKAVGLLEEVTRDLREVTNEVLPTLSQATEAASAVNVELARVDTIIAGVQSITATTDQLVGVVHATVSNPLIKAAAFAAGTARASRKLRS